MRVHGVPLDHGGSDPRRCAELVKIGAQIGTSVRHPKIAMTPVRTPYQDPNLSEMDAYPAVCVCDGR